MSTQSNSPNEDKTHQPEPKKFQCTFCMTESAILNEGMYDCTRCGAHFSRPVEDFYDQSPTLGDFIIPASIFVKLDTGVPLALCQKCNNTTVFRYKLDKAKGWCGRCQAETFLFV